MANTDRTSPTTGQSSSPDSKPDLFDLAAQLAGCAPLDLLRVRVDPEGLVVILATGQKFIFNPASLGEDVGQAVRAQLAAALGAPPPQFAGASQPPAPAPALRAAEATISPGKIAPKAKRAG